MSGNMRGELTDWQVDSGDSASYLLDLAGNIDTKTAGAVNTSYGYNGDLMTSAGSAVVQWDSNGQITAKGAATYDWDFSGRLRSVDGPAKWLECRYGPDKTPVWQLTGLSGETSGQYRVHRLFLMRPKIIGMRFKMTNNKQPLIIVFMVSVLILLAIAIQFLTRFYKNGFEVFTMMSSLGYLKCFLHLLFIYLFVHKNKFAWHVVMVQGVLFCWKTFTREIPVNFNYEFWQYQTLKVIICLTVICYLLWTYKPYRDYVTGVEKSEILPLNPLKEYFKGSIIFLTLSSFSLLNIKDISQVNCFSLDNLVYLWLIFINLYFIYLYYIKDLYAYHMIVLTLFSLALAPVINSDILPEYSQWGVKIVTWVLCLAMALPLYRKWNPYKQYVFDSAKPVLKDLIE